MSQTLDRGMAILDLLADGGRTVNEIAGHLGVHHSTALRLLHTLEARRMVTKDAGLYGLGPRVIALGQQALASLDLRRVARPHLAGLGSQTGETVHLAQATSDGPIYIDKVESQHPIRMYSRIGRPIPVHCTGVGKAILAFMSDADREHLMDRIELTRHTDKTITTREELDKEVQSVRARGYALDDEEHEVNIRCVAFPILDALGDVLGAVSVTMPKISPGRAEDHIPVLKATAAAISEEYGYVVEAKPRIAER